MKVKDLVRAGGVRVIHRERLICEVAGILDQEKISGAPLVDDNGDVVGIVSKSDIVHFEFVGGDPYVAQVWEIGQRQVLRVHEDEDLRVAARKMLDGHVHRLVVIDADGAKAMLTSLDFVRLVADQPEPT